MKFYKQLLIKLTDEQDEHITKEFNNFLAGTTLKITRTEYIRQKLILSAPLTVVSTMVVFEKDELRGNEEGK